MIAQPILVTNSYNHDAENRPYLPEHVELFRTDPHNEIFRHTIDSPDPYQEDDDRIPSRHYNQMGMDFDIKKVSSLFKKLAIKPDPKKVVTIFGGYTGEYAEALRQLGFTVIFTDPMEHYVEKAKANGFEAYCVVAEALPSELIERSTLISTFECPHPFFHSNNRAFTALRLLTAPEGIVMAMSKATKTQMRFGNKTAKRTFRFLKDDYDLVRKCRSNNDFDLCQIKIGAKDVVRMDGHVMKALHDMKSPEEKGDAKIIGINTVDQLVDETGLCEETVRESIERILSMYQIDVKGTAMQAYTHPDSFFIHSKSFKYDR